MVVDKVICTSFRYKTETKRQNRSRDKQATGIITKMPLQGSENRTLGSLKESHLSTPIHSSTPIHRIWK